jgi:hypothetical protein
VTERERGGEVKMEEVEKKKTVFSKKKKFVNTN